MDWFSRRMLFGSAPSVTKITAPSTYFDKAGIGCIPKGEQQNFRERRIVLCEFLVFGRAGGCGGGEGELRLIWKILLFAAL